jgi:hypothetical protein
VDLDAVATEIATQLDTIDGLRVYGYPPDSISPPAGVLSLPTDIDFDKTYGRGMDRLTWPLLVIVGKVTDRTVPERLYPYCSGSGESSVKAVLEAGTYTALDMLRVTRAEPDVVNWHGTDYVGVVFELDIAGSGA